MTALAPAQERAPVPDQEARGRIAVDVETTLFVEAGAGSGKTTALVDRVVRLVVDHGVPLGSIAAITFTEKAGAELRDRIRQVLGARAGQEDADAAIIDRCQAALDELDGAAIGTLHAFAQRVLAENPVEAGLPPRLEVLDEVSSDVAFERRWAAFLEQLLADPVLAPVLLLFFAAGPQPEALRALAVAFDRSWDLVDTQVDPSPPPVKPLRLRLAPMLDRIQALVRHRDLCSDADDPLCVRLEEITAHGGELRDMDDELDLLEAIRGDGSKLFSVGRTGRAPNWKLGTPISDVRDEVAAIRDDLATLADDVTEACVAVIAAALRRFTLTAAEERRQAGQLSFHDLLVLARALVQDPRNGADVRTRLHGKYRRILLDEFQDTDPIQIDLAVRIAAARPDDPHTGTLPWDQVEVDPGRLFIVGDPKQSIYRFRRADIATFLEAQRRFGTGGGSVALSANFRTGASIIDWVNETFGRLISETSAGDPPVPSQPAYVPLTSTRPDARGGLAVSVIGRTAVGEASAGSLRAAEAAEVAATIVRIVAEGWEVGTTPEPSSGRPAQLGDITVLVPARTSLPFLEDALDTAGVAYRAEASSLVYASRAVRDLLMVLRAADDPTDHLAVVAALRTPLLACGDDDLFRFKVEQRGSWNHAGRQPPTVAAGPVAAGLAYLRSIHDARHWHQPAELLERIARDRRAFELGFAEGRTRDVWRRLRYVIDQARSWSEVTAGGTRQYLQWVQRQTSEGARVAEAVLPETDDDAVRIMTIHAAKGLEFPITIVSGMSTVPQSRPAAAEVVFPRQGGVGYKLGRHVATKEYIEHKPVDEQMGYHERLRLLYVACTRAKDHLVVSVQRKERKRPTDVDRRTNAELLVDGMGDLLDGLRDAAEDAGTRTVPAPQPANEPPPFDEWEADLRAAIEAGSHPTTVAATALRDDGAPEQADWASTDSGPVQAELSFDPPPDDVEPQEAGLQKRPRDLDLPPWAKGRYGTAVGRAVHGALQTIDLATGAGLDAAVAAQCEAETVAGREDDVARLVRAALGSPVVREAADSEHWREVFACTPLDGGRLLEGYIDLLYRAPAGMVVVDYKTAATDDPVELARRVAGYRLQGASYALTVQATTGEAVDRVVFLFLTPSGAVELDLPDVEAAMADVRRLVAAGTEHVLS